MSKRDKEVQFKWENDFECDYRYKIYDVSAEISNILNSLGACEKVKNYKPPYEKIEAEYKKVIETGIAFHITNFVPHPKFGEKHLELKAFKCGDGLGMIFTDITERVKAESDLNKKIDELDRFNKIMVGRESKMLELISSSEIEILHFATLRSE